ncbi:DUF6443 domain-containing protein [Alistipes communis]|uniref:DUF6443 domain-containing protein n=1 Tax=Alistipes communis TaxID=2585118 RepID=UPI0022E73E77|nr:DUF6443 domain-containing protein [Alistipes communis]
MKKLYLQFILVLVSLQTAFAQVIWHPNLGTGPSGDILLGWNSSRYVIHTEDGDEFSSGDAVESMNQQLADLGIRWVHVPYIDNPATGCYEITLELDANTTNSERSIAFGNLLVRQSGENFYPAVGWPTDHCYYICPGQSAEIQLYDTVLDENYYVWRTYEDDIDEEIDFFTGTGGNYTYYLSTLGTYRFDFPNSDFTIKYYEAFDYVYDAGEEILSVDPNGGIYRYSLTKYWKDGIMYPVYDLNDVAFLDAPFAIYNSGGSTCWDAHMQISYGYDDDSGRLYLEIYCPPNLSESAISNQTNLRFDDDMAMEVYQPEGGAVLSLPVIYKFHEATSRFVAYIDSSQPDVVYTLYRDGVEQSTTLGNGKEIALFAPNVAGYYHVMATYEMNGITDSAELNGARYDSGHILALDENSSWILTKTFQNENSGTLDVTYYNGLGLPEQTVQVQASPNGQDIILPIDYDIALRDDAKIYLPYVAVSSDGRKQVSPFTDQQEFYKRLYGTADSERSFTEKLYEASPLNRVLKQALPGYVKDHEVVYTEFNYRTNTANEVRRLAIGVNDELICGGYYDAGMLACTVSTAPDGHIVQNFTDKRGLTLLNRTFDDDEPINTYFVYDDYDRLQWVIMPEGSCRFGDMQTVPKDDKFAKDYCYVYTYNDRGLMTEKRMPGREAEYMRYDEGDRLRVSQDGNLRAKKQWISYSYDALGRVQEQSLAVEAELIPIRSQAGVSIGEPIESVEPPYLGSSVPLRKYVYDTYPSEVQAAGLDFQPIEGLTATDGESLRYDNATGSLTYEKLAVLANDTITGYHQRACYYDYKGRVIQTVERDTEDGILCTSQRYDFVGNLIAQRESYTRAGKTDDIDRTFTYDDRGRLLSETTQVNGGELAVVDYEYDELGRLSGRMLGTVEEQSDYDIRSWLTAKSSELFDMSLRHSYTGNITSWQWQHKGDPSGDGPQNRYEFTYDDLSRLTHTDQYVNGERVRQNVERHLSYDRNGNLLSMIRYENGEEQCNMKYQYQGNHLYRYMEDELVDVDFGADTVTMLPSVLRFENLKPWLALHEYDANGNVTKDWERGLDMSYNCLNLLEYASDNDANAINYCYLADGTKLSATTADDCGFSYRGSFTYRTDESSQPDRVFESTSFGGGRIVGTVDDETEVRYFLTDHLGSVRAVVNSGCEVLERNDYQPFGKRWVTPSMPVSDNRDRFNGKEDQSFAGLPFSDYGARMYDYERGRWLTQDRFAEKYYSIGQYNYCAGNPVNYIDIKGDSLMIIDMASIISIYNGLAQGQTVTFRMNNGVLDPTSFADVATNSDDFFLQDLFNIAQNSTMVELSTASHYTYLDQNGVTHTNTFEEAPYDSFTSDIPEYERYLLENGEPIGRSIVGNLGQTKFPGAASLSGRRSTNKNVQIVINAKGNINHQSVGLADEFGHVLLYMQGLPHGHGSPSANTFINKRTNAMKIRLGYDF